MGRAATRVPTLLQAMLSALVLTAQNSASVTVDEIVANSGIPGGLVIHVGSTDGALETEFARRASPQVRGLAFTQQDVDNARTAIMDAGFYGIAAVELWDSGRRLPLADGLANLVVAEAGTGVPEAELKRIVAPGGALVTVSGTSLSSWTCPRPSGFDDWPYPYHDAGGSKASADELVGPPQVLQWLAGPRFNVKPKIIVGNVAVCYDTDDDKVAGPTVYGRDGRNGMLIWRRGVPFSTNRQVKRLGWGWGEDTNRRYANHLSAGDNKVFAACTPYALALDPGTGATIATYETPEPAAQVLFVEGKVLCVTLKGVYGFAPSGGKPQWSAAVETEEARVVGSTIVVADYAASPIAVVGIAASTGSELWRFDAGAIAPSTFTMMPVRVTCAGDGRVVVWISSGATDGWNGGDRIVCLDAATGRQTWQFRAVDQGYAAMGYNNHVIQMSDRIWTIVKADTVDRKGAAITMHRMVGLNPATGAVATEALMDRDLNPVCQPAYATARYLAPRDNMIEIATGAFMGSCNLSIRAGCGSHSIPGLGLVLTGSHVCSCGGGAYSFPTPGLKAAIQLERASEPGLSDSGSTRLEPGPAAGTTLEPDGDIADEWPIMLGDPQRTNSRSVRTVSPQGLHVVWGTGVPGMAPSEWREEWADNCPITGPTVAAGKVFVAGQDAMAVYAMDAESGTKLWNFVAGGAIDSPPTYARGLCVFGCADGYVYALRARDGALVWRHRVARSDRRVPMYGQIQSAWPVFGSVLVQNDKVHMRAGWYSFGAMTLWTYALDLATGALVSQNREKQGSWAPANNILAATGVGGVTADRTETGSWARTSPSGRVKGHATTIYASDASFRYEIRQSGLSSDQIRVARIDSTKVVVLTYKGAASDGFESMLVDGDVVWVAGWSLAGSARNGYVRALKGGTLEEITQFDLVAPPVFHGLARANGKLYVSLRSGMVVSIGGQGTSVAGHSPTFAAALDNNPGSVVAPLSAVHAGQAPIAAVQTPGSHLPSSATPKHGIRRFSPQAQANVRELPEGADAPRTGVQREFWAGFWSDEEETLPIGDRPATGAGVVAAFVSPPNRSDHFVEKLTAYVRAPRSGEYLFWLAADEQAELYIDGDSVDLDEWSPEGRTPAAEVREAVVPGDYDASVRQQTYPIRFEAGRRYLLTVIHKEGVGSDHCSLVWQLPGQSERQPVPAELLSPPERKSNALAGR